jgi:hypothetical protein
MKWYLVGTTEKYWFWFRNPRALEHGTIYQASITAEPPETKAGYYSLETLMKLKDVTDIEPAKSSDYV